MRFSCIFTLFFAAVISPLAAVAEVRVPALNRPVVDSAQIVAPETERGLNTALEKLWQSGGSQLAVLTVPTLGDLTIEQYSIAVVDQWQLGTAKDDNGVLFIIAPNERELRIEVGQGLEGVLTDAHSKRIIDEHVIPLFKVGDMSGGILVGVNEILKRTDPNFNLEQWLAVPSSPASGVNEISDWVVVLYVLLLFLITFFSRRGTYFYGGGIPRSYGGGFGGGGFGGGGFRGGGGGFSGGGASGRW